MGDGGLMSDRPHAVLSPSSSERWIQCPASVRLAATLPPEPSSPYAAEGTRAHTLAEIEASFVFDHITRRQRTIRFKKWLKESEAEGDDVEAMQDHVAEYVGLIKERAAIYPNSQVLLEQRLATGVGGSWGTSDTVIVSPEHVEIIDLKYGQGVPVSAINNPQLRLYALGALDTFGDILGETEVVFMTVHQPRLQSVSTEEISAADLRAWRQVIIPIAERALGEDAEFGPSESACRWCPAAGICRARMEYQTQNDFAKKPDTMTAEEIAEILEKTPDIRDWCSAVENYALDAAYSKGESFPGWKVVMSSGNRYIPDDVAAIDALAAAGFPAEDTSKTKVKGVGALEKLVGKDKLPDVLGDLLARREGKPSLVKESDKRPAINPESQAAAEFAAEPQE